MIPPLWLYINAYSGNKLHTSGILYYLGLSFFGVVLIDFINLSAEYRQKCHDENLFFSLHSISICLYVFQAAIIVLFLFIRLMRIFKDTLFAISKRIIQVFITFNVSGLVFGIFGLLLRQYTNNAKLASFGLLLWGIGTIIYVFTVSWLNYLFITKLMNAHRNMARQSIQSDQTLVETITKITLLCFVSTSNLILFVASYVVSIYWDSPHSMFISRIVIFGDLYTNFLSVILSFKYFEKWYKALCAFCDRKCHTFWSNCVNEDAAVKMNHMMEVTTISNLGCIDININSNDSAHL